MKNHPHLTKKFALLYSFRINPTIRSHADLAKELGITRQAVSRWARGTESTEGDSIPLNQLDNLGKTFCLDSRWFNLSLEEFEIKLRQKLEIEREELNRRPEKISLSLLPITSSEIFGREREMELLDSAWSDSRTNVLQMIAFGGVGKSSTINSWLSRLDKENYRGANKIYAWSFYWQGSSSEVKSTGDFFIEHALDWFGDPNPTDGTPWTKASRRLPIECKNRTIKDDS